MFNSDSKRSAGKTDTSYEITTKHAVCTPTQVGDVRAAAHGRAAHRAAAARAAARPAAAAATAAALQARSAAPSQQRVCRRQEEGKKHCQTTLQNTKMDKYYETPICACGDFSAKLKCADVEVHYRLSTYLMPCVPKLTVCNLSITTDNTVELAKIMCQLM